MPATTDTDIASAIINLRRDLHRRPELAWHEHETAGRIAAELERIGVDFRTGVAGTGIVAEIPGRRDGPLVALRADMDALPIHEETGLPFASEIDGRMHACGHDAHVSMVMGAVAHLAVGEPPPATVRVLFQPAEEVGEGAKGMVEAGALENVALIFGGHVDRAYPTGTIVVHEGAVNASADMFRVEIVGKGAHAARPHEGVDALAIAALVVTAVQTVVSRELNPAAAGVLTVGKLDAGTAANVVAGRAVLEGTIRAQSPDVREHLAAALERISRGVAETHGASARVVVDRGTPALINTAEMAALAREAALAVAGEEWVRPLATANMGGEDFAVYLEHVRGCYVRFGVARPGRDAAPAHSSRFDVDEDALPVGARFFAELARRAGATLAGG